MRCGSATVSHAVRRFRVPVTVHSLYQRAFGALFEEKPRTITEEETVPVFQFNTDSLDATKALIDRKATGIPFQITPEEALEKVRLHHHGAKIMVEEVSRLMIPFWLTRTAAAGSFNVELLQSDSAFMTQQHCHVWVEGPRYDFSYPFDEYMPMNQICGCYVEPLTLMNECVRGTHIPSMLISRFELLEELRKTSTGPPVRLSPFTVSHSTALSLVEKNVTRNVVMNRIESELRKFHGRFLKANVSLRSLSLHASHIRPVFLPVYKYRITTLSCPSTVVSTFVCGAVGKTVGPVLHMSPRQRAIFSALAGLAGFAPLVTTPILAVAAGMTTAAASLPVMQRFRERKYRRQAAAWEAELKQASLLNLPTDLSGYRWSVTDEEKQEFEYREQLRQEARAKKAFRERVTEETRRDFAHQFGKHVDPKTRRRTDLRHPDPLGYYSILGLTGREYTVTSKEIAAAFRMAAQQHHPDVSEAMDGPSNGDNERESSATTMQRVIEAYKVLQNETSRRLYDSGDSKKRTE